MTEFGKFSLFFVGLGGVVFFLFFCAKEEPKEKCISERALQGCEQAGFDVERQLQGCEWAFRRCAAANEVLQERLKEE